MDPQKPQRQQIYLRALETIPNLTMHHGTYRTRRVRMPLVSPEAGGPRTVEVWRTDEKGSDVNLATHLLLDAFRGDCEVAVVVSNDSDLKEPIERVRFDLGIPVGIINPHPPGRRSHDLHPTFFKQIRESALRKSQFPATMQDSQGTFTKPARW
jgi:hypothetical protein